MNAGGETADQVIRMSLQGIEIAANVALKLGGTATKSLAAMLYAILTDQKKVKGKARLQSMLKSGKELSVFAIRHEDLKTFCEEAKKYGVLYSVLKEKNNTDGICDIMVRTEDASKIDRMVDKFKLATIDTNAIRKSILDERSHKESPIKDIPIMSNEEHDNLVGSLMASMKKEPKEVTFNENPSLAQNKKSPVLEQNYVERNIMGTSVPEKTSVRKELSDIKQDMKKDVVKKKEQTKALPPKAMKKKKVKTKKER
ncbi:MAG: PcfB family protein [Longicatena sp.]